MLTPRQLAAVDRREETYAPRSRLEEATRSRCPLCKRELPPSEFPGPDDEDDGLRALCNACWLNVIDKWAPDAADLLRLELSPQSDARKRWMEAMAPNPSGLRWIPVSHGLGEIWVLSHRGITSPPIGAIRPLRVVGGRDRYIAYLGATGNRMGPPGTLGDCARSLAAEVEE